MYVNQFIRKRHSSLIVDIIERSASAESDQIKSDQIKSDQIRLDQIKSDQIRSNQIKSDQIRSNQIKSDQIRSNQIKSDQIRSNMSSSLSETLRKTITLRFVRRDINQVIVTIADVSLRQMQRMRSN